MQCSSRLAGFILNRYAKFKKSQFAVVVFAVGLLAREVDSLARLPLALHVQSRTGRHLGLIEDWALATAVLMRKLEDRRGGQVLVGVHMYEAERLAALPVCSLRRVAKDLPIISRITGSPITETRHFLVSRQGGTEQM
jgi:hypothetical protein